MSASGHLSNWDGGAASLGWKRLDIKQELPFSFPFPFPFPVWTRLATSNAGVPRPVEAQQLSWVSYVKRYVRRLLWGRFSLIIWGTHSYWALLTPTIPHSKLVPVAKEIGPHHVYLFRKDKSLDMFWYLLIQVFFSVVLIINGFYHQDVQEDILYTHHTKFECRDLFEEWLFCVLSRPLHSASLGWKTQGNISTVFPVVPGPFARLSLVLLHRPFSPLTRARPHTTAYTSNGIVKMDCQALAEECSGGN